MVPDTRVFIASCWLIFWISWLAASFSVKKTAQEQGRYWKWRFAAVSLVLYLAMRYVPVVSEFAAIRLWPSWLHLGLVADVLALTGLAVMLWARVTIGRDWSGGVVLKEDHQLAVTGPYAAIRHPIYAGLLLLMLGTAVDYGVIAGFIVVAAFAVIFVYKSRVEERFMTRHFPEKYPAYMKKTKAFIPYLF